MPDNWRIVSTNDPMTPAASLLFQAPTFQAPTFQEPAPPQLRRGSHEDDAPEPAPAKRQRRSRTRQVDPVEEEPVAAREEATPVATEDTPEEAPARKSRSRRRSKDRSATTADEEPVSPTPQGEADAEDAQDTRAEVADATEEESDGASRRRRRRRSRSAATADVSDEVQALKGSTRLEAKKQRRREGRKEGRRRHTITESEFLARRESVDRQMVIRHKDGLDQIAVLEDDLLVEHYVARRTNQSMVGNIYLGRVQNVLPSMEAAFVDIGRGRNAVLYAGEVNWDAVGLEGRPRRIESALKSGDPVLVQVTKDPIGHKGARLTSQITLAGRYLVLIPNGSMMGISRKLPENERARLKKVLKKAVPGGSGVIVRTAAEGATEEQIADDVARLARQWADIEKKKDGAKSAPLLLRGEPELAVRVVRDIFNEDFRRLVIQGEETFDTVSGYVTDLSPELSERVEKFVGTGDVFQDFRVDEQLAKGMDRKVWLPSGGTLIIDRTEAMTVIDVNTGKYIGAGGTLEETVTRNNLEAAEEIVRQMRLRDIGGIVIVDFVDMVLESNRDLVLRRLVECLGRDRTRHQVTEITSLGLVQMTRKRVGEGLVEAFSTPCEACEGRGFIVHTHPVEQQGVSEGPAPKHRKQKKTTEEPRRIDTAEHERVRQAVSAIAAASHHKDEDGAEIPAEDSSGADLKASASAPEAQDAGETPVTPAARKPRRRRAVRVEAAEAVSGGEPATTDVETPAAQLIHEDAPVAPTQEDQGAARPATKRRGRRRVSTPTVVDPERSAQVADIELPAPVTHSGTTATSVEEIVLPTHQGTSETPKRARRRRAVTTSVVEPEPTEVPRAPETTSGAASLGEAAPTDGVSPQERPVRRGRRRAATTGVVDAG